MNLLELNKLVSVSRQSNRPLGLSEKVTLNEQAQENIELATFVDVTYDEALVLLEDSKISPNTFYKISECDSNLYGGTNIVLTGLSKNSFTDNGYGEFYNPKYYDYPVFSLNSEYEIDEKVIYGGRVWKQILIPNDSIESLLSNGDPNFSFNLVPDFWEVIPYNDEDYIRVWDEIIFDFETNLVLSRYEAITNNKVTVSAVNSEWFYCGLNPLKVFRWGHYWNDGTQTGVRDCTVENSYFNILNFVAGYISDCEIKNYSFFFDLTMNDNNCYLDNLKITNNSWIVAFSLTNSFIENCSFKNFGAWENILINSQIEVCEFENLNFNNNSFNDFSFNNSKLNKGNFVSNNLTNSTISEYHSNNSTFSGNYFVNANFYCNEIKNSNFYNSTISNHYFSFHKFLNCVINNLVFSGGGDSVNWIIQNVYLNFDNYNGIQLKNFYADAQEIKFRVNLNLSNNTGEGAIGELLSFPKIPIPSGFFFSSIILELSGESYQTEDNPKLNLGFTEGQTAAIDNTIGDFSNINGKTTVLSIEQNSFDTLFVKSEGPSNIFASITTNPITTSNNLKALITLKSLTYNYYND